MPFEIARKYNLTGAPKVPADAMVINSRRGPRGGLYLGFQIGDALAEELGFAEDARLEVAWGTEGDRGKLRLRVTESGAFRLKRSAQGQKLLQFYVSDLPAGFSGQVYRRQRVPSVENLAPANTRADPHVIVTLPHNFYERRSAGEG